MDRQNGKWDWKVLEKPLAFRWLTPMSASVRPSNSKAELDFKAQTLEVWCAQIFPDVISRHTRLTDSASTQMHADYSFWEAD